MAKAAATEKARELGCGSQTRNADEAGQTENQQGGGKTPRANRRLGAPVLIYCSWTTTKKRRQDDSTRDKDRVFLWSNDTLPSPVT